MSVYQSIPFDESVRRRRSRSESSESSSKNGAGGVSFPKPQIFPAGGEDAGNFPTFDEREARKIFKEDILPVLDRYDEQLRRLSIGIWTLGGSKRLFTSSNLMHKECLRLRSQLRAVYLPADEFPTEAIMPYRKSWPEETIHARLLSIGTDIGTLLRTLDEFSHTSLDLDQEPLLVLQHHILRLIPQLQDSSFSSPQEKAQLLSVLQALIPDFKYATASLVPFNDLDVPCIQSQQKHSIEADTRSQTMMIFFSAVTITGIQFTFQNNSTGLDIAVNFFWFGSLALSACAILLLQQSMTHHQDIERFDSSPSHDPYSESLSWLPGLLSLGGVAFFAFGFVIFSWSSSQHRAVSVFVTITVPGALTFLTYMTIRVGDLMETEGSQRTRTEKKEKAKLEQEMKELLPVEAADIA